MAGEVTTFARIKTDAPNVSFGRRRKKKMPADTPGERKKKRSTRGFFKALKGRSRKVTREAIKSRFGSSHKSSHRPSLDAAFSEIKRDEPSVVAATRRKKGETAAQKQRVAIAFSKAGLSRKKPRNSHKFTDKTMF